MQQNLVLDTIRKKFLRFAHKYQNSGAIGFMAVEQAVSQAEHNNNIAILFSCLFMCVLSQLSLLKYL